MKSKGFTLIETIVVVAIISILAFFGVENIIEFQKNALLSSTAQEFTSALRHAQNMSITGALPEPFKNRNLDVFTPTGLPGYRVNLSGNIYTIFSDYQLTSPSPPPPPLPPPSPYTIEVFSIDTSKLSISSLPMVTDLAFDRLTGIPHGITGKITYTISRIDNPTIKIDIIVDEKGVIDNKGVITPNPL